LDITIVTLPARGLQCLLVEGQLAARVRLQAQPLRGASMRCRRRRALLAATATAPGDGEGGQAGERNAPSGH
jgi:hypothetical protein